MVGEGQPRLGPQPTKIVSLFIHFNTPRKMRMFSAGDPSRHGLVSGAWDKRVVGAVFAPPSCDKQGLAAGDAPSMLRFMLRWLYFVEKESFGRLFWEEIFDRLSLGGIAPGTPPTWKCRIQDLSFERQT